MLGKIDSLALVGKQFRTTLNLKLIGHGTGNSTTWKPACCRSHSYDTQPRKAVSLSSMRIYSSTKEENSRGFWAAECSKNNKSDQTKLKFLRKKLKFYKNSKISKTSYMKAYWLFIKENIKLGVGELSVSLSNLTSIHLNNLTTNFIHKNKKVL